MRFLSNSWTQWTLTDFLSFFSFSKKQNFDSQDFFLWVPIRNIFLINGKIIKNVTLIRNFVRNFVVFSKEKSKSFDKLNEKLNQLYTGIGLDTIIRYLCFFFVVLNEINEKQNHKRLFICLASFLEHLRWWKMLKNLHDR